MNDGDLLVRLLAMYETAINNVLLDHNLLLIASQIKPVVKDVFLAGLI